MIFIKKLIWSNWFSYGENNSIDFEQPVLQVLGFNGVGKTSIPIILQEVFYGKNSKGKKKSSLVNRYLDNPTLTATCYFSDGTDEYKIDLSRKTTLKLKLLKNNIDISSHTTTATYKTLQSIIGLDFKTFAQLTYQSSTDKLEFLTATDANRKKFLISLFALDKYIEIQEQFKKVSRDINTELTVVKSKISTIESWISSNENMDFTEKNIQDMPEIDDKDIDDLGNIRSSLKNITETNKKINRNNTYKELLKGLDTEALYYSGNFDIEYKNDLLLQEKVLTIESIGNTAKKNLLNSTKATINKLGDKCHSCKQSIAKELKETMLQDIDSEILSITNNCKILYTNVENIRTNLKHIQEIELKLKEKDKVSSEITKLTNSIDNTMAKDVLDEKLLSAEIKEISSRISTIKTAIDKISKDNRLASAHNSKIEVILGQLKEHRKEIIGLQNNSDALSEVYSKVELIKKAFSPSGLPSYKIDYLVKDLEKEINKYLGTLSSGKFQLLFKLENDKLNIEIIDEGIAVGIEELSAGELARINAASLLAVRKLMAAISSNKINVLFLDEVLGVLDEEGKEMLIEVLQAEENLNTLLVSHSWAHPLVPKINIVKEGKISRIEENG